MTRIADLAHFARPARPARPRPAPAPARPVLVVDLAAGASIARAGAHKVARRVRDYRPRGVLLRWRHCWWDLNGFFCQPVALARGGLRRGTGGLVVSAATPRRVLAALTPDERARIARARRAFHAALDRVLGRDQPGTPR